MACTDTFPASPMRTRIEGDDIVSRIFALVLLSLFLMSGHAEAADKKNMAGKPPHASAYDGLLPAGMTPTPAPGFHPSQLRGARVALVPSANFNEWARIWANLYEEGGFENYWGVKMFGHKRETFQGYENNSDPRNLAERIVQTLQPHVGEVFIATDLVQARDAGADYYLILDGWLGSFTRWNMWYQATGGVYLLDGALQQVFEATGTGKAELKMGMLDAYSSRKMADIQGRVSGEAMEEMLDDVTSTMQRQLAKSY